MYYLSSFLPAKWVHFGWYTFLQRRVWFESSSVVVMLYVMGQCSHLLKGEWLGKTS